MKVIDAHTGWEVRPGMKVPMPAAGSTPESSIAHARQGSYPGGYYVIHRIHPGIFKASADVTFFAPGMEPRSYKKQPLKVRWTHPGFMFQHIAFVPS